MPITSSFEHLQARVNEYHSNTVYSQLFKYIPPQQYDIKLCLENIINMMTGGDRPHFTTMPDIHKEQIVNNIPICWKPESSPDSHTFYSHRSHGIKNWVVSYARLLMHAKKNEELQAFGPDELRRYNWQHISQFLARDDSLNRDTSILLYSHGIAEPDIIIGSFSLNTALFHTQANRLHTNVLVAQKHLVNVEVANWNDTSNLYSMELSKSVHKFISSCISAIGEDPLSPSYLHNLTPSILEAVDGRRSSLTIHARNLLAE